MSSNALRVVPVIDGIGDVSSGSATHCCCICVNNGQVFLGRVNGTIACYRINSPPSQSVSIPTVELDKILDTGARRPISSLSSVGSVLVAVANEAAYVFQLSSSEPSPAVLVPKDVLAVAVQEQSSSKQDYPRIAVSLTKKRVSLFSVSTKSSSYVLDKQIPSAASSDLSRLVWFNQWLIGANAQSYVSLDSEGLVRDIMPVDAYASIAVLKSTNEVLLVGQDGLGIFMNVQADGLSPAPRNTISISHTDASVCVLGQYLVSLSSQDGIVDVFSLASNDTKLIQTINLPSSGLAASNSFSTSVGVPVVAGSVLYLLITVPFESQLTKLVENGKLEEALELVNYQFPPGPERDNALLTFHRKVGWKLWNRKKSEDINVAFVHFSLSATGEDVEKLMDQWTSSDLKQQASQAMASFLRGFRLNGSITSDLRKRIDSLLIELLTGTDELVEFIKSGSCTLDIEEAKVALTSKSPAGLAVLLEQHGSLVEAINVLTQSLPNSSADLLSLLERNLEQVQDPTLVDETIKRLVGVVDNTPGALDNDRLGSIILRSKAPLALADSLKDRGASIAKKVLISLADTNGDALERLLKLAVSEKDVATVERLIHKHKLRSVPMSIETDDFSFARMLILGNKDRFRDAFAEFPELGEKFIEQIASEDKARSSQLVILLAAVLFESNKSSVAVDLLIKNEDLLFSNLRASQLVEIIPTDTVLTRPLIEFLKRLNRRTQNKSRNAIVNENQQSFRFLNTYNEWSDLRQTNPSVLSDESTCSICGTALSTRVKTLAVLPNGNMAHATCLDSVSVRTAAQP